MRSLLPLLLLGCNGDDPRDVKKDRCEATWDGFARPFLTTWCTPCHSSTVAPEDRFGAPAGVDFDTYEHTLPWVDVIAEVAGEPGDPMPPAGGVTDGERAALSEWVACGAPGPEDPPTDPCAGAEQVIASLVLDDDAAHECLVEVTGDLAITGAATAPTLPRLAKVGGDLTVDATLTTLALPALAEVGGTLSLAGVVPGQPDLTSLATVGGLSVSAAELVYLSLPRLEQVAGDLRIESSPALSSIVHTSDLEEVGGSLVITGNPELRAVRDFAFLTRVGGDLELGGNGAISSIEGFWTLASVGGEATVRDEPALALIDGFSALTGVGALRVARNPALGELGIPNLETVDGDLVIEDDDALQGLVPLFGITRVGGDLVVRGNAGLEPGDVAALISALEGAVEGAVILEDNGG